ncbi:MAG: siroheme decarboxylase subunit beta [Candidatus Kariarchaeaceae archaeon]
MISNEEMAVLSEVQQLPLVSNPFTEIATRLRMDENKILAICENLLSKGLIRRFGLSLSHRKIGIMANLMVAVNVPKDRIDEVGKGIASESQVSHCYYRTGWDYNLFFMLHSQSKEEVINLAKEILEKIGISDYRFIFSIKEFKKTSFMFPRLTNDQYEYKVVGE